MALRLPDGTHMPARSGKYLVVPPPDLNQVEAAVFLLEYDFPFLVVKDLALPKSSAAEYRGAIYQAQRWHDRHSTGGGSVGGSREGYRLTADLSSQFVPAVSYIDADTWSSLSDEAKDRQPYLPCVPAVVIELVTAMESMEGLQVKVAKYIQAGTMEAVVVDTKLDRVWIHNQHTPPHFMYTLRAIAFDAWPGFTLDCEAIRDARVHL